MILILGAVTLAGFAAAVGAHALWLDMGPLLPLAEGQSVCFAGSFSGRSVKVGDWARYRNEPTGRVSPDGHPMTRPVPGDLGALPVQRFVLSLAHSGRESQSADKSYADLLIDFDLVATIDIDGRPRRLRGRGDCDWDPHPLAALGERVIYCGIDCDGGGISFERVALSGGVRLRFDPRTSLRMKLGCGGGGSLYQLGAPADDPGFVLAAAPAETCRAAVQAARKE